MIGHKRHPRSRASWGQFEGGIHLIEDVADVLRIQPAQLGKLAVVMQTTLSVDDVAGIAAALKARFPQIRSLRQRDVQGRRRDRAMARVARRQSPH